MSQCQSCIKTLLKSSWECSETFLFGSWDLARKGQKSLPSPEFFSDWRSLLKPLPPPPLLEDFLSWSLDLPS